MCLHGRGIDGRQMAWLSRMDELAEREGAVVAFPEGSVPVGRRGRAWDLERDLPYLVAVVDSVRDEFAWSAPVCVAGISNGAWMACRFAESRARDDAAVGAVAGIRPPRRTPARPVPVVAFHGRRDRRLPYEGGPAGYWHEGAPEAARAWAATNGVEGDRSEAVVAPTLTRTSYGGETTAEVVLWTFARSGHTWPGSRGQGRFVLQLFHGRIGLELDATAEIWRFYRAHAGRS